MVSLKLLSYEDHCTSTDLYFSLVENEAALEMGIEWIFKFPLPPNVSLLHSII